jgi:hypothetical protein
MLLVAVASRRMWQPQTDKHAVHLACAAMVVGADTQIITTILKGGADAKSPEAAYTTS